MDHLARAMRHYYAVAIQEAFLKECAAEEAIRTADLDPELDGHSEEYQILVWKLRKRCMETDAAVEAYNNALN